jgi:hypothetical protein
VGAIQQIFSGAVLSGLDVSRYGVQQANTMVVGCTSQYLFCLNTSTRKIEKRDLLGNILEVSASEVDSLPPDIGAYDKRTGEIYFGCHTSYPRIFLKRFDKAYNLLNSWSVSGNYYISGLVIMEDYIAFTRCYGVASNSYYWECNIYDKSFSGVGGLTYQANQMNLNLVLFKAGKNRLIFSYYPGYSWVWTEDLAFQFSGPANIFLERSL